MMLLLLVASAALGGEPTDTWPRIFGPSGDGVIPDQPLNLAWTGDSPPILWSLDLGEGYSAPSIRQDAVIVFHRLEAEEVVDRVDLDSAKRRWRFTYPTSYVDQYGYNNGPRSTPIIEGDVVYTLGAEGKLHALRLETGEKIWGRWLNRDFKVRQDFFGVAGTPALTRDRLIINVGGEATGAGVVAIDKVTGETAWTATEDGPSYASPAVADIHGRPIALAFTKAGLVALEEPTGKLLWSEPFRSRLYESVNATSPLVVGDIVLVSATYGTGSLCLRIKEDGSAEELWRSVASMDSHFSNLIHKDGFVYGFAGRHEPNAELRCIELTTGRIRWSVASILGRGSMLRMGERFILWGERGHLLTRTLSPDAAPELPTDPREHRSLLRYPCWTPPALVAGRLFLRNETELLCLDIGLREEGPSP